MKYFLAVYLSSLPLLLFAEPVEYYSSEEPEGTEDIYYYIPNEDYEVNRREETTWPSRNEDPLLDQLMR